MEYKDICKWHDVCLLKRYNKNLSVERNGGFGTAAFFEDVSRSLIEGVPIVEFCNNHITKKIIELWKKI